MFKFPVNPETSMFLRHVAVEDSYTNRELERSFISHSKEQFDRKTAPSLLIPKNVGNMYTATLYSCIASLFVK